MNNWLQEQRQSFLDWFARELPDNGISDTLTEAIRYAALGGGKRVRPMLALAANHARGGGAEQSYSAAGAVELIHTYSLIHDDLPAMDDDALRHGKPTCHVVWDEATAILAGDAIQTLAFQFVAQDESLSAEQRIEMIRILAQASGAAGMVGGQMLDMAAEGKSISLEALQAVHRGKTGALIRASVLLGAWSAAPLSTSESDALDRYSRDMGLAFQIIDDVLDVTASTQALGKTAGKDIEAEKSTYVALLGLEDAKQRADTLLDSALAALAPFGEQAEHLRVLARFIVQRQS